MAKKNTGQLIQQAAADIGKDEAKRPTDKQSLKAIKKQHPHLSTEEIVDRYGLSL